MRGNKVYKKINGSVPLSDKILCSLFYPLYPFPMMGVLSFIYLIISFIRKERLSSFVRFHVFQSILLAILISVGSVAYSIIYKFFQWIPLIGSLFVNLDFYLTRMPLVFGKFPLIDFSLYAFSIYLAISALLGKYSQVPWVSDMT